MAGFATVLSAWPPPLGGSTTSYGSDIQRKTKNLEEMRKKEDLPVSFKMLKIKRHFLKIL